jgi:hypothetical protein
MINIPQRNIISFDLTFFPRGFDRSFFSFCCRGLSENGNDDEVERPKTKVTIVETEDANYVANLSNLSNVTSNVVGKVGSMFGKGIGGLSTKFGSASNWF